MSRKLIAMAILFITLGSCNEEDAAKKEDIVKAPPRDGSVEVIIGTKHDSGYDILTSEYKIWNKDSCRIIKKSDTLVRLGNTTEQIPIDSTDSDGEPVDAYKSITVPKDYEIYITVK